MQQASLDFTTSEAEAGFRLSALELYNWGTFDGKVWTIRPQGHNSLLTGDIGSGKSTIVDAVLTLLVPQQKLVYNKAAGAESRERTLASYIRGEYKSERDDLTQGARAVALRDETRYTVLLARFTNLGYGRVVTLAQVFHLRNGKSVPDRLFVVAEQELSIAGDFSGFGADLTGLRKQLRSRDHLALFSTFKEYSTRFRHLFGIHNSQALNLFYQTVSMKSVGNLTEFVRLHMLEPSDVRARLQELRTNFDNLSRAHEAVRRARQRIEELTPLCADLDRLAAILDKLAWLRTCRESLDPWFQSLRIGLLDTRIRNLQREIATLEGRLQSLQAALADLRNDEADLRVAIDDQGGRRIEELSREITRLDADIERARQAGRRLDRLAEKLGLAPANDRQGFLANREQCSKRLAGLERELEELRLKEVDLGVMIREIHDRHQEISAEIESLRKRTSNIPSRILAIRTRMAEVLQVEPEALPFAGELLQVDEKQQEWQGAIERVLHNFGLSLLVPAELYSRVSRYVDKTNLRGRLVYFRVPDKVQAVEREPDPELLCNKLRIKPDTPLYDWLDRELTRRFDHRCCTSLEDFRHSPRALTLRGQVKSGGRRHEKDDRTRLDDHSRYVLGWSNRDKIRALAGQAGELEKQGRELAGQAEELAGQQRRCNRDRDRCRDLLAVDEYGTVDWQTPSLRRDDLVRERTRLEEESDILQSLRSRLAGVREQLDKSEQEQRTLLAGLGGKKNELAGHEQALADIEEFRDFGNNDDQRPVVAELEKFRQAVLGDKRLDLRSMDRDRTRVREHIQGLLDNREKQRKTREHAIVRAMGEFRGRWPGETAELDVSVEAGDGYRNMLDTLTREDLPRHEQRFKELLNEGTINSIALFQGQLDRECDDIESRIEAINGSLRSTEYNPGTFIELRAERTQDADIRGFREELRQCLSHSLGDAELYNEERFLRVQELINRFNGREGLVDVDRRWTAKVTDVRNWYIFSAVERWQEDGTEKEYYAGSSGKSGGQKEKLAYTILASALAYQFGLEWGAVKSRSFRFVVIDEAFGRGSDESTRYGLELFKRLNLQLLIVTPLQKIHVIEDYIHSVHYIHNPDGRNSQVRNLTIEEYRQEKERRREQPPALS
jgi:uncharacterized protein YPO0396